MKYYIEQLNDCMNLVYGTTASRRFNFVYDDFETFKTALLKLRDDLMLAIDKPTLCRCERIDLDNLKESDILNGQVYGYGLTAFYVVSNANRTHDSEIWHSVSVVKGNW